MSDTPPHDLEAEAAVLGAVLLTEKALGTLVSEEGLEPGHFYRDKHREVFTAMLALADKGETVDTLTVTSELKRRGLPAAHADVDSLTGGVPNLGGVRTYARTVIDLAEWRQKLSAAFEIVGAVRSFDRDQLAAAEGMLNVERAGERAALTSVQMADRLMELLDEGEVEAWPLPFERLTRLLAGGFKRGGWTVLSAHSSWGKSVLAGQAAEKVAEFFRDRKAGTVRYYVVEGDPDELAQRAISRRSGINFGRLAQGQVREDEQRRFVEAVGWWAGLGIVLVPAAGWTPEQVARDVMRHRPDFWVVDLLNNLDVGRGDTSDWDRAVRVLGAVPKQTSSHMLLVAHLNESRVGTKRLKPTLGDLRSTGMLKNGSDNVVFIYREQTEDGTELLPEGQVYVAKARNAILGGLDVVFEGARQRFLPAA